jgi:hypothetical protein
MRPTTRPTASPTSPITGDVAAPPSEAEAPLSSFSNPHAVEEEEPPASPVTTSRRGTKRPRESRMCRRGSRDAGEGADRAVVALAPRTAIKTTRAWAVAAASASAHVTAAHSQAKALDQTIRARVQRLLIQFVMLPVVWVSLCCVITAAMGIEAMESIHKALVQDDEAPEPPAKKTKRNDPSLEQPTRRRGELPPPSDDECGLVFKLKTSPSAPDEVLTPTPPSSPPPRRRRRRVLIWDLDETLVLFASLYSGQFARSHGKDVATSVVLGEQMMTYLVAVLERHFFFSDLHNTDVEHISTATESAPSIAERYARIRAIYERRSATPVDFLDDPTSQWFTARQALVTSIDMLSTGWIREAHELLALTQSADNDDEVINVMVTNTQLSPALCKCLLYGLDAYFPIECVYSSSKVRKMRCFQTIMAKYAAAEDRDVEFIAIGDGPEEEQTSLALGLPFCKVRSLDDLRGLRYELQLVDETPMSMAKTLPTTPPPVASSPPTAQCP